MEHLGGAPPITFQVLEKHLGTQPQPDVVVITVVVGGSWYPTHGGCRSHESYPPITRPKPTMRFSQHCTRWDFLLRIHHASSQVWSLQPISQNNAVPTVANETPTAFCAEFLDNRSMIKHATSAYKCWVCPECGWRYPRTAPVFLFAYPSHCETKAP